MRTLFLSQIFPYPPNSGTSQRVLHLVQALAEISDVTFVYQMPVAGPRPDTDSLKHLAKEIHSFPRATIALEKDQQLPPMRLWIKGKLRYCHPRDPVLLQWERSDEGNALVKELCTQRFDVIWAERLASMRLLPSRFSGKLFVDLDDLEHRKLARRLHIQPVLRMLPLELLEYVRLRRMELSLPRLPHDFVVCSARDRSVLGGGPRVHVIPNGVDVPASAGRSGGHPGSPVFVFVGHMGYQPNIDAMCFFCLRILPLIHRSAPDARLMIVGRDPHPRVQALHNGSSVVVTGTVASTEPYLREATALVAPIRIGGGTRIKILEALAHRTPIVTTSVGAEGLDVVHDKHVLLADSPGVFAKACLRLHREPWLGERLGSAGLALVRGTYDWTLIERRAQSLVGALTRQALQR